MRELHVVGAEDDGTHVVCQDPESGEKYRIAADERLRAAARGDISRLGQIEIDMESSLRPREIQARIRAGATVPEVAALAGVPVDKVERFAHPVLLERARATELATMSHPLRDDGPATSTLGEIVAEAFVALGHSQQDAEWDCWKGEDGRWVVQVGWKVGRSENHAHWRFQPGSHGGTADPIDDLAEELTHPEHIRPRRRLTPVATPDLGPTGEAEPAVTRAADGRDEFTLEADRLIDAQRSRSAAEPVVRENHDDHGVATLDFETTDAAPAWQPPVEEPEPETEETPAPPNPAPAPAPVPSPAADAPASSAHRHSADDNTSAEPSPTKPRRRSKKPPVPAWEDVLLGVRSNGSS